MAAAAALVLAGCGGTDRAVASGILVDVPGEPYAVHPELVELLRRENAAAVLRSDEYVDIPELRDLDAAATRGDWVRARELIALVRSRLAESAAVDATKAGWHIDPDEANAQRDATQDKR